MGIQYFEQRFGDFGKLVIQLVVHAPAQQCKSLNQSFDVRIFARILSQHQAARRFRIFLGELRCHLADKRQLSFVIWQQVVSHELAPETAKRRESRWRVTSKSTDSPGSTKRNTPDI